MFDLLLNLISLRGSCMVFHSHYSPRGYQRLYNPALPRTKKTAGCGRVAAPDLFLPIVGFVVYLFFGRHLYGEHIFSKKTAADEGIAEVARDQYRKRT